MRDRHQEFKSLQITLLRRARQELMEVTERMVSPESVALLETMGTSDLRALQARLAWAAKTAETVLTERTELMGAT